METTPHQGIGWGLSLTDEGVTFKHFDSSGASHNAGEEGWVVDVGVPGKGRIQWQEPGHLTATAPALELILQAGGAA